jgi:hypothetical protein
VASVEDVHELAAAMPHVTTDADGRVYQVGGKSLQLLREVRISLAAGKVGATLPACSS